APVRRGRASLRRGGGGPGRAHDREGARDRSHARVAPRPLRRVPRARPRVAHVQPLVRRDRGILRRGRTYGTTGPTMSRARTKLLVLLIAALLIILGLRALRGRTSSTAVEATDESLIDGRVWVEGRPDRLTDYVHAAIFISRANFG